MGLEMTVAGSDQKYDLKKDETILDGALRHGLNFPYGCRSGFCGSCKGTILQGEVTPIYDDLPAALSEDEINKGIVLCCQFKAKTSVSIDIEEVKSSADIEVKNLPTKVAKMEKLSHDVMRLYLKLPATDRLQFLAGQYIDIIDKTSGNRSFSMANAPHNDEFIELHIRHVDGGIFTEYVFDQLKEKDLLRIEGPLGGFYLREDSERSIIMMAGGTGFAPIKSLLEHLFAKEMSNKVYLYWGVRAKRDLYLHELAAQWAEQYENFEYIPVLSDPMEDDVWFGRKGFVHEAIMSDFEHLDEFDIYTCGPPVMIDAGKDAFASKGFNLKHYYSDAFEFAPR